MPLGNLYDWAQSNGRIGGMKLHVVYNPKAGSPGILDINDAQIIETGAAYVFDKGYCHYGWWTAIAEAGASFAWLEEAIGRPGTIVFPASRSPSCRRRPPEPPARVAGSTPAGMHDSLRSE
jgi:hypothetical protein